MMELAMLLREGCWYIDMLVTIFSGKRDQLVSISELPNLVETMKANSGDAAVQHGACGLVWLLAKRKDHHRFLRKTRVFELVFKAATNHLGEHEVQYVCLGALAQLAVVDSNRNCLMKMGVIKLVIQSMQRHQEDMCVQLQGCAVIARLANKLSFEETSVFLKAGLAIAHSMRRFRGKLSIQANGCFWTAKLIVTGNNTTIAKLLDLGIEEDILLAMRYFSIESNLLEHGTEEEVLLALRSLLRNVWSSLLRFSGTQVGMDRLLELEIGDDMCHAIMQHENNSSLQAKCLHQKDVGIQGSIMSLAAKLAAHSGGRKHLMDCGIVNVIANTGKLEPCQFRACVVFYNLSLDKVNHERLIASEFIYQVMHFMNPQNPGICRLGLRLIAYLSSSSQNRFALAVHGAMGTIGKVMRDFRQDGAMQALACETISEIAWDQRGAKIEVWERGIYQDILCAMRNHRNHIGLQFFACKVWSRVIYDLIIVAQLDNNRESNLVVNVFLEIVQALRCHSDHVQIVCAACTSFMEMCRILRSKMIDLGVDNEIQLIMEQHYEQCEILAVACYALSRLGDDADSRRRLMKGGILNKVLTAMVNHPNSADVQAKGSSAIQNLSKGRENALVTASIGVVPIIQAAMQAHPGSVAVQTQGCAVFGTLAFHNQLHSHLIELGVEVEIAKAMETHEDNLDLLQFACQTLSLMVARGTNTESLERLGIPKLFQNAAQKLPFNKSFQSTAAYFAQTYKQ